MAPAKEQKVSMYCANLRRENDVKCVFVEPQYGDKDAFVIASSLDLPLRTLDAQGANQQLSETGYAEFIQTFTAQFKACFS